MEAQIHQWKSLSPKARTLFHLQALLQWFLLWLPLSMVIMGVTISFWSFWGGLMIGLSLGFICFVAALWLPSIVVRRWGYSIRETDLLIVRGLFIRSITAVPLNRVQHVDTRQGILEQWFGLARIKIYTASGMGADGIIPGLDLGVANALRDELVHVEGEDGV